MKTFKNSSKLLVLIIISLVIFSCKKDKNTDKSSFNINNPQGYAIVMMNNKAHPNPVIAVFNEGNKVTFGGTNTHGISTFRVANDEIIIDDDGIDLPFKIQNGKIIAHSNSLKSAELIKVPNEDQLAGKTFTGVYHKNDGSVLHPKFYYTFHSFGNKVDVGYQVGTVVRTESYVPMGNVGAFIRNGGATEFIIKMSDGAVVSNYNNEAYGLFK